MFADIFQSNVNRFSRKDQFAPPGYLGFTPSPSRNLALSLTPQAGVGFLCMKANGGLEDESLG